MGARPPRVPPAGPRVHAIPPLPLRRRAGALAVVPVLAAARRWNRRRRRGRVGHAHGRARVCPHGRGDAAGALCGHGGVAGADGGGRGKPGGVHVFGCWWGSWVGVGWSPLALFVVCLHYTLLIHIHAYIYTHVYTHIYRPTTASGAGAWSCRCTWRCPSPSSRVRCFSPHSIWASYSPPMRMHIYMCINSPHTHPHPP